MSAKTNNRRRQTFERTNGISAPWFFAYNLNFFDSNSRTYRRQCTVAVPIAKKPISRIQQLAACLSATAKESGNRVVLLKLSDWIEELPRKGAKVAEDHTELHGPWWIDREQHFASALFPDNG
jgi:hypothetical protein